MLSPADTVIKKQDKKLQVISKSAKVIDGNVLTTEYKEDKLFFSLPYPQFTTTLRYLPVTADNCIKPGNIYELYYWNHDKWESLWKKTACYHYLETTLLTGQLYWLKCLSEGREEQPFTIDEKGNINFIYE